MTDQDFETMLFNESSKTATLFVARAVTDLDAMLGEGYAVANPAVLALRGRDGTRRRHRGYSTGQWADCWRTRRKHPCFPWHSVCGAAGRRWTF